MIKDFYWIIFSLQICNYGFSIDFEKYTIDDKSGSKNFEFIINRKRKYIEIVMFCDYSLIFCLKD
jgi:hypothetical protein